MVSLTVNGYNPIPDKFISPVEYTGDITKGTGFIDVLNAAKKNTKAGKYSTRDLADVIKGVEQAARRLHLANIPISMITRKYIRIILNECGRKAHKFNKSRTYLMILFNEMIDAEATEQDSMARIKKRKLAAGFAHHGHIRGVSISEF